MKNKIIYNTRKKRIFSQPKQNSNLSSKANIFINEITEIYNSIYDDLFPSILCLSKTSFFEKLNKQVKNAISSSNSQNELQTSINIRLFSKTKEDIVKKYDNDYKILFTEYQCYLKNNKNYKYLTHFRKHCVKTENYALHNCSSKKQGKFIEVKIKNKLNNKEEISYVICVECKQCYFSNFILMVCPPCNKKYFSNVLNENENENILPATWNKYHCGSMIDEIMKCIQCRGILYLNLKTKELVCQNKNCNFIAKPESILWKCFFCSKEFRSGAKVYNPLEFKILKKSINLALLLKIKSAPKELPCRCEKDLSKLTFLHKDECKGELYKGMLIDKEIIVCSKCHAINFEEKFTWICPICSIKFHLHSIVGCKPFSKKKYVINRHFNQSVKYISKKNKNKDKEKKEKNMNNINLYNKKEKDTEKPMNIKHTKNQFSIDIFNSSIKRGNTLYKNEENEIYNEDNKNVMKLKKTRKCPNTSEKRKKHYSTLLEILQERKSSQSKYNYNETNDGQKDIEISDFNHIDSSSNLYNSKYLRNKKDKYNYKNKTCDNYHKKDVDNYLKDNLQVRKHISSEINSDIVNDIVNDINKNNDISSYKNNELNNYINSNNIIVKNTYINNNTEKSEEKRIKVNKRFHYKLSSINGDESINENNKQKEIIKGFESTDFSSFKTLSSNEHNKNNTKYNILYNITNTTNTNISLNPLNSFRCRNEKSNTNTNYSDIKGQDLFRSSNLNEQLTENSYQDIINGLRNTTNLNMDTFNSSYRITQFGNNSTLNELIDLEKKYSNNNTNESKNEISEIKLQKKNTLSLSRRKSEKGIKIGDENNVEKEERLDEKELDEDDEKTENYEKKESGKKELTLKSDESENCEENEDKFEETPYPFVRKKNVLESVILNSNDYIFQNVLITQDKLNSLAKISNIPSFEETDYNFIRPIGEGTYGEVYLVENNETSEQFALKKIVCRDYNELIKHKNELELIFSVRHENILNLCGISFKYLDETTSAIYVLMELAHNDWNMEIKRRIIAKKYYKEKEIIDILKQIIKGFLFLQEKNIAHRDIKPQNILLFPNNVYKIADFGEAKNIKNIAQQSTLRGSELYMSPVLYKGYKFNQKNVLHNPYKSDVFSLGYCLLYAICLNLKVLETARELTTMRSIISCINKYIIKSKYSDKLMNLIYKMIDPNESERFDFEDLSLELQKF